MLWYMPLAQRTTQPCAFVVGIEAIKRLDEVSMDTSPGAIATKKSGRAQRSADPLSRLSLYDQFRK